MARWRIVFMGTPAFAVPALERLFTDGHDIACVYTQPPRPRGRGHALTPSPVHERAQALGLRVLHPRTLKDPQTQADFSEHGADFGIVAAYGLILPKAILDSPHFGCVNIHASLLPRWRGASPIHHAILHGDPHSGITLMHMDEGLDTGAMIAQKSLPILPDMTTPALEESLRALGAEMIGDLLQNFDPQKGLQASPQPENGVTYAGRLSRADGKISWTETACALDRRCRAFTPWPGLWTTTPHGKSLQIREVCLPDTANPPPVPAPLPQEGTLLDRAGHVVCGNGTLLRLLTLQPAGRKAMDMTAAINGGYIQTGDVFT